MVETTDDSIIIGGAEPSFISAGGIGIDFFRQTRPEREYV
jgi:hypothetical protein